MEHDFKYIYTDHVAIHRGELFGIACLAVVGVASILRGVANEGYKKGRYDKEREMKREYKKYQKNLKKEGKS